MTLSLVLFFILWLQPKPENAVTIAVSTRVLFRTEREQKVFEQHGVEEYLRYQIEHENEPFAPGPAFPFVKVEKWNPLHGYLTLTGCAKTHMDKHTDNWLQKLAICFSSNHIMLRCQMSPKDYLYIGSVFKNDFFPLLSSAWEMVRPITVTVKFVHCLQ